MGVNVGSIDLGLDVNQKSFNKQLNGIAGGAQKSVLSAFKPLGKMIGVALGGAAVISFAKSCLQLGSDLDEVQNVVDVTFQKMNGSVNEFAKNAMDKFGLSETVAKKYMGTYGAMTKAFGFGEEQAYNMAEAITGLTADVASFYNLETEQAYTKMKSIWTGETESLKDLGIVMTQTALDSYALNNGFGKTTAKMTEQEKVMLRYQFVMSQLSLAQGDFARTSEGWANQTRVLGLRFEALKATLGQGFINIFTPIIKMINTLLGRLQVLAESFKSFTEMLTGKKSEASGIGSIAGDIANATNASDGLADSTAGIGSAAKKASKQIKGALAGFDNLNTVSSNNEQESSIGSSPTTSGLNIGSTGLVGDMTTGIEDSSTRIETVLNKIKEKFDMLKTIDTSNILTAVGNIKNALAPITEKIFGGLSWGWDNILVPLSKWTIEDLIPSFLNLVSGALTILNPLLESFKGPATWLWVSFLQPIATWTGGVIVDTLNSLALSLTNIGIWMSNNQGVVGGITTTVLAFFAAWKLTELFGFIQMSGGIVTAFISITAAIWACTGAKIIDKAETLYITALYAKDFVLSIVSGTGALIKQGAQWVINTGLKIADTVATTAMTVATTAWNVVAGIATTVTTALGAAIAFLTSPIGLIIIAITALIAAGILLYKNWDTVKEKAISIFAAIKQFIIEAFEKVKEKISSIWTTIKDTISIKIDSIKLGISTALNKIKDTWNKVWTGIKDTIISIFNGIWDTIKGIINKILGGIEGMANGVIKGVNKIISALNNLSFDIPDWIPGLGGKSFGFSIPSMSEVSIPRLAQGGYVGANQPQLAIIGDNKREGEVVAPESKLRQLAIEAAKMSGGGMTEEMLYRVLTRVFRENPLILEGDAKGIFRLVKQESEAFYKSTGKEAFSY